MDNPRNRETTRKYQGHRTSDFEGLAAEDDNSFKPQKGFKTAIVNFFATLGETLCQQRFGHHKAAALVQCELASTFFGTAPVSANCSLILLRMGVCSTANVITPVSKVSLPMMIDELKANII
ncbi:hypothetical protein EYZ11_001893 [Aspergillus tanneri]|uniref:Uncharacterized protein n=1 Tax=Aspergillus tanneri TaxID=1220188 RepID=A0A4S3JSI9_9EURO|nr:hypothetical protein EYZ11_001893 [Aspergillus tanneri]